MDSKSTSSPIPPKGGDLHHGIMALAGLVFLFLIGIILPHGDSGESLRESLRLHPLFGYTLVGIWLLIGVEALHGLFTTADPLAARLQRFALTALLPPLRMTTATSAPKGWLWLPGVGWQTASPALSHQLEHRLAMPMVVLTLLVLPVLGVEFGLGDALESRPALAAAVHLTTSIIWVGFTAEFIWMLAATPHRLAYCQKNWINLIIILIPLVAFLRVLTTFRFVRMLRAGKLLRTYRLRTLQTRVWRLVLLFNLIDRLQQRDPAKYCASLEKKIHELETEVARLKDKLTAAREIHAATVAPATTAPEQAAFPS